MHRWNEQEAIKVVGANLRHHRKRAGLTLEDLSRLSGVGLATLSHTENGNRDPKLSTLVRLSHALRVDIADLFKATRSEDQPPQPRASAGYDLDNEG